MSRDGGEVQVSFCPVPTPDVQADVLSVGVTQTEIKAGESDMTNGGEQGKGLNLGLNLSLTPRISISKRNVTSFPS